MPGGLCITRLLHTCLPGGASITLRLHGISLQKNTGSTDDVDDLYRDLTGVSKLYGNMRQANVSRRPFFAVRHPRLVSSPLPVRSSSRAARPQRDAPVSREPAGGSELELGGVFPQGLT